MEAETIWEVLAETSFSRVDPVIRECFVQLMTNKLYGRGPMICAWHWYIAGINTAVDLIAKHDVILVLEPTGETEG